MNTIHEVVDKAGKTLKEKYNNCIPTSEIKKKIIEIGGYAKGSILPSDYCYNRINKAPYSCRKPSLELIDNDGIYYKYWGLKAQYTGQINWKPKNGELKQVGEWKNGTQILKEDPRNIKLIKGLKKMKPTLLERILSCRPDKPLYHYTTMDGLLGIVGDKEMRATHTQYLSDHKEYSHALSLVADEITKRKESESDDEIIVLLGDMLKGINGIESMNVCVCSFSEERDSLSQWRAYGDSAAGFAIGFRGDFLYNVMQRNDCYLVPCVYDKPEQVDLIKALVDKVLEENIDRQKRGIKDAVLPSGGNLVAYLHRYAPILKDSSFKEEREWRVITRPLMCSHERFNFRPGNSMLIPFYRLPLVGEQGEMEIHEIVVGPTPHTMQSLNSVRSFLWSKKIKKVEINNSKVPYRDW